MTQLTIPPGAPSKGTAGVYAKKDKKNRRLFVQTYNGYHSLAKVIRTWNEMLVNKETLVVRIEKRVK
jgi:hypothetical protein